jgi:hypothetical protein
MAETNVPAGDFDKKTLKGAEFCLNKCPACTYPRKKGRGILYRWLRVEAKICPWCKAYKTAYGVPAWENPPEA